VDEPGGFDKLVSVGMYEHVAQAALADYFGHAWKLLKPTGVFLAHGMASAPSPPSRIGPSFLDTYVFPDSELVPVSTMLGAAESAQFEVHDVESLRDHYVITSRRWLESLESHREDILQVANETVYRIWRLLLAAMAYRFAAGHASVYQTLLVKPDGGVKGLPLSRADWYV
jgi:cyclopropane-fatty-acyl-phospholipid synthase